MAYLCYRCNKVLDNIAVDKAWTIVYDKCKGKNCPHCGKIRKLGSIKITLFNGGASDVCPKCGKHEITAEFSSSATQGVCNKCFWEDEEKKGCICIHSLCKWDRYYCSLCKDIHTLEFKCKECANENKIEVKAGGKLLHPWQVIVPSFIGGVVVGGFLIGFIFGRKWKVKKSSTKKPKK